jgi:hypothetical protein
VERVAGTSNRCVQKIDLQLNVRRAPPCHTLPTTYSRLPSRLPRCSPPLLLAAPAAALTCFLAAGRPSSIACPSQRTIAFGCGGGTTTVHRFDLICNAQRRVSTRPSHRECPAVPKTVLRSRGDGLLVPVGSTCVGAMAWQGTSSVGGPLVCGHAAGCVARNVPRRAGPPSLRAVARACLSSRSSPLTEATSSCVAWLLGQVLSLRHQRRRRRRLQGFRFKILNPRGMGTAVNTFLSHFSSHSGRLAPCAA